MDRVETFLQHYVEQPYDPVKAHEYYLKNRDLKGRTTSGMSQKQKEAWDYVKNNIDEDKKKQIKVNEDANTKKIDEFQATAAATRKRISDKLKLLSEKLTTDSTNNRDKIDTQLKSEIANVPAIPEGVTGIYRERLVKQRNKKIADIRNTASAERGKVSNDVRTSRVTNSDGASTQREKVGSDLKLLISKTRDEYTKAKEKLKTSYEAIYAKEYKRVLSTVQGNPKAAAKAAAKAKVKAKASSTAKKSSGTSGNKKAKTPAKPKPAKQGKIIYYTKAEMAYNRLH